MKRIARSAAKALCLAPPVIYGGVAALLLLGAWGSWAFMQTQQIEQHAADRLATSVRAVAEATNAPFDRFAELTASFRASDITGPDRVGLTARLLRLQNATPYAGATFAANAAGRLVAASAPFPAGETDVGNAAWFRAALARPAGTLAVQRIDASWLRSGPTVVVTRMVPDQSGQPAGLIGTLLQLGDLRGMIRPSWIAPSVGIRMIGSDDSPIVGFDGSSALPATGGGDDIWGPRLLLALGRLAGQPSELTAAQALPSADAVIEARLDCATVFQSAWPALRRLFWIPAAFLIAAALAGFGLCLAAWARGRERSGQGAPSFGMDWSLDLDRHGIIIAVHGFAPAIIQSGIGNRLPELIAESGKHPGLDRLASALSASVGADGIDLILPDGADERRIFRTSLSVLREGGFRLACRDVTLEVSAELRAQEAEAAARAQQDEMAAAMQDRDRILAAVGHDIRTPINSILGICTLLLDKPVEEEHRTWIRRIGGSCEALLAMLNGLLEIASGPAGRGELQSEPVDVASMVHEVADVLAPQAHDKGLALRTRVDDLLTGAWLLDATRLRQVLFNLTSNAIKFTGHGWVEVQASVVTSAEGQESIRIAVADTGPGIAPEDRERIFERFRRGRSGTSGHEGLGLGLALCRENAQLMGGSLTVESSVGSGSEFVFQFPANRPEGEQETVPFAGRTALVVSHQDAEARAVAGQLERLGCSVECAYDGYIGLGMAERIAAQHSALDIVVVDAGLSGLPAEAFVARLRGTAFGSRTTIIWIGQENGSVPVDAVVRATETSRISSVAARLLGEQPSLEALDPSVRPGSSGRILVVEDNQVNQSLLTACLAQRGFATFVASDGEEAVRLASQGSCDAILMDIQLPGIDGFEATRRIRNLPGRVATVPIIALTGLTGAVVRKRCEEAGLDAFVEKPIHFQRLLTVLRKEIARASRSSLRDSQPLHAVGSEVSPENLLDVSPVFLETMVSEIGLDRTKACVYEFLADAATRCLRLHEMLPGWEADAIRRICHEISGVAGTVGAIGLADALMELSDVVARGDRTNAETLVTRIEEMTRQLRPALSSCLQVIAVRRSGSGRQAAS